MVLPINYNKNLSMQSAKNNISISYFRGYELDQIFDYTKNKIINNKNHEKLYRRYYFLMKVLLYTGARIEEIVPYHKNEYIDKKGTIHKEIYSPGLRSLDINLDIDTVTLPTLKKKTINGKLPIRVLPVSQEFKNEYMSYAMAMHIDVKSRDPLFPITRKAVNKFMSKMEKDLGFDIHPHKFRHTFAVTAVLSGIPLNVLQQWLAHSSIFITSIYTQITGIDTTKYMEQMDYRNL